ncbi:MAG TPA: hypothetical protein VM753_05150 [Anaeromyxobacter sp.]|jgi:hypothetical protein|nr:hypothetical protein [Anaeromyxobacter sp.]
MDGAHRALAVVATLLAGSPALARAEAQGGSNPLDDPTLVALAFALAATPAPEPQAAASAPGNEPQLELVATVRARSIVFADVPHVSLKFTGPGPRRTTWRIERVNLPARVQPGVAYRDVTVRLTLTTTMDDLAVLLRDARAASRGLRIVTGSPGGRGGGVIVPGTADRPASAPATASTFLQE